MKDMYDHLLIKAAHLCHSREASKPIGKLTSSCQGVLEPVCDRCKGVGLIYNHPHVKWMTSHSKRNSGDDRQRIP
jgi:hypothetical protein